MKVSPGLAPGRGGSMLLTLTLGCGLWVDQGSLDDLDQDADGVRYSEDCDDLDVAVGADLFFLDGDGDGYGDPDQGSGCEWSRGSVDDASDCDDADPARNPDTPWYPDGDGDGWGQVTTDYETGCDVGEGWSLAPGDCDDADGAIYPGAEERCDGVDSDCDGAVDEEGAVDAERWYADQDGDGYGDPDEEIRACTQPADSAAAGGEPDCDDRSPGIHPGADEICSDGIDNDCDGLAGACEQPLADGPAHLVGEKTWDYAGYAIAGDTDLDGDGLADLLVGAKQAGEDEQGVVYAVSQLGAFEGRSVLPEVATAALYGAESERLGQAVAAGDLDGDGIGDVVVSSSAYESETGAAFVFYGPLTGELTSAEADAAWIGQRSYERAGTYLASAGDVNGDGWTDLLVSAPTNSTAATSAGCVYLLYGPAAGGGELSGADAQLTGVEEERAGEAVNPAGDLDGDGLDDLLVGARQYEDSIGAAYALFGPQEGDVPLADADVVLVGDQAGAQFGYSVSGAGDLNGDGYGDFAVGANYAEIDRTDQGAVFLFFGPATGAAGAPDADLTLTGEEASLLGGRVTGGGDFDGDGAPDLLVGASRIGDVDEGAAYLILGPVTGGYAPDLAAATLVGEDDDKVGARALRFSGDIGGDGQAILVGAYLNDGNGTDAGAVWIVSEIGL